MYEVNRGRKHPHKGFPQCYIDQSFIPAQLFPLNFVVFNEIRLKTVNSPVCNEDKFWLKKKKGSYISHTHRPLSSANIMVLYKTLALLTMPKPLTVWMTINCGKF